MKKENDKISSEYVSEFLAFLRLVEKEYNISYNTVGDTDKASQDLLHQIEFGEYKERGKFATQLAKVRRERRLHKDFLEIHKPLYEYIQTREFIKVRRDLEEILGKMRKEENKVMTQRVYRPRILTNLTIKTTLDKK